MADPIARPLEHALSYARRSWPVAPAHTITARGICSCGRDCDSPGKHPRTEHGLKDATTDESVIRAWWERWPDANVLIRTGMVGERCLLVVDVDPRHDGDESLSMLQAKHGQMPLTPRALTGGGGMHLFFWSAGPIANSVNKLGRGVDVRGEGGYVVAAPSRHASGVEYVWDSGAHPEDVQLAEAPGWLVWLAGKPRNTEPTTNASAYIEGGRNTALTSMAGMMRDKGFERAAIEAALLVENDAKCRPPLDPREVQRIATSVARYAPKNAPVSGEASRDPWNLMDAAAIFAPLPPYPWLLKALHLAPGRITLLNGYADVGKTVIAMTMAMSISTGKPLWGLWKPERPGHVLHLNAEIGSYIARERYQRIARAMDVDVDDLIERGWLRLANYPLLRLDDPAFEPGLRELCAGAVLVIIDSLRAFSGALDENSKEIGVALLMLARVSEATGATIVVLHHNRKPSKDDVGGVKMAISGSSSILGAAECAFVMTSEEKGGPITVHHERSPIGRPLENFGLQIRDVEHDGDPRWGLAVVHLDREQMAEAVATSQQVQERVETNRASESVRGVLKRYAGTFRGSREAFRAECGIGKIPFLRALNEMRIANEVSESGTYHKPEWHLR